LVERVGANVKVVDRFRVWDSSKTRREEQARISDRRRRTKGCVAELREKRAGFGLG